MYIKYTWPLYFIPALGLSLKSVVLIPYFPWNRGAGVPSSRAAPGVVIPTAPGGLGGDGSDSAVPRCFQCCIQFLSFMLLLLLTIVQHVLCYLAHVNFLMMLVIYHGFTNYVFFYAKCFVRNDEIKLWNQSLTIVNRCTNFNGGLTTQSLNLSMNE